MRLVGNRFERDEPSPPEASPPGTLTEPTTEPLRIEVDRPTPSSQITRSLKAHT
jgi:hypothetical protein